MDGGFFSWTLLFKFIYGRVGWFEGSVVGQVGGCWVGVGAFTFVFLRDFGCLFDGCSGRWLLVVLVPCLCVVCLGSTGGQGARRVCRLCVTVF